MDSGHRSLIRPLRKLDWKRWSFPLVGLISLVWFLVRVIPKPSRAAYPCQRAAFPLASGFVLWLIGLSASFLFFRRARQRLHQARYAVALASFAMAFILLGITYIQTPTEQAMAADEAPFVPVDAPNDPVGQGRGIYPGRVVWSHNPDATDWDGTGYWWSEENTNQIVIDDMLSQSLRTLAGAGSDAKAWDKLFKYFNARHDKGEVGYQPGEKFAIKLNLNQVGSYQEPGNQHVPAPQLVLSLTRQLVNEVGVSPADIAYYDASRYAPSNIVDKVLAEFPGVRFADWEGGREGREAVERDLNVQVHWSEDLVLEEGGGNPTYLPTVVTEAEYLINMGVLKGHSLAGVTMCAKNLFGSFCTDRNGIPTANPPIGAGVHPYVTVHPFHQGGHWDFDMRDMGTYNALVDLMGHEDLGEKTLLFVVDALYPKRVQNYDRNDNSKWQMAPFDDDWASSIFLSQDFVAIESVGLDFLRTEPTQTEVYGNVDNYLHEAAMADDPPSGEVYAPNGDGVQLTSLGAHEHWNNPIDKQYSRNLGEDFGIELVTPEMATAVEGETAAAALPNAIHLGNYPNPFNPSTTISFTLPAGSHVRLEIFDALGQQVAILLDDYRASGSCEMQWDGGDAASGAYFARLITDSGVVSHKLLLAR